MKSDRKNVSPLGPNSLDSPLVYVVPPKEER